MRASYVSTNTPREPASHVDAEDRRGTSTAMWLIFHGQPIGSAEHSRAVSPIPSPFEVLRHVRGRLVEISRLPYDWDGNGGIGSTPAAHRAMLNALQSVCD